jgi:CubicO group peptidase (beta-lactamase class C family)
MLWRRDSPGPVATLRHFDAREAPSGTRFHYKGPDPETLGLVLKAATGMTPAEYLSSRIWSRIGTEAPASWGIDASGQEAAFCCISATLRDWGRLGALLANDGAWDGKQIIPRDWLLAATTADPAGPFAPRVATRFWGCGYLTWIFPPLPGLEGRRLFALHGVHGQAIYVDPVAKLVLVHTAVRKMPAADPGIAELIALWAALVRQEGTRP